LAFLKKTSVEIFPLLSGESKGFRGILSVRQSFLINLPGVYVDLSLFFFVRWCYEKVPDAYPLSSAVVRFFLSS